MPKGSRAISPQDALDCNHPPHMLGALFDCVEVDLRILLRSWSGLFRSRASAFKLMFLSHPHRICHRRSRRASWCPTGRRLSWIQGIKHLNIPLRGHLPNACCDGCTARSAARSTAQHSKRFMLAAPRLARRQARPNAFYDGGAALSAAQSTARKHSTTFYNGRAAFYGMLRRPCHARQGAGHSAHAGCCIL